MFVICIKPKITAGISKDKAIPFPLLYIRIRFGIINPLKEISSTKAGTKPSRTRPHLKYSSSTDKQFNPANKMPGKAKRHAFPKF